jgi:DNA segregation ATPase FtsK/SpoIIIE, S-DNA-T family
MAKNTIRSVSPKTDSKEETKARQQATPTNTNTLKTSATDILSDRRTHIFWGGFLIVLSLWLFMAFVSYLLSGAADQSVVASGSPISTKLKVSSLEIENKFGFLGAVIAHLFMFRWFGVSALVLPMIIGLIGVRITFKKELLPLKTTIQQALFYMIWVSMFMGFIVVEFGLQQNYSLLCGGFGYEFIRLFKAIGWGSIFIVLGILVGFVMYYYNVSSINDVFELFEKSPINNPFEPKATPDTDEEATEAPDDEEATEAPDNETPITKPPAAVTVETDHSIVLAPTPIPKPAPKPVATKQPAELKLVIENTNDVADQEEDGLYVPPPTSSPVTPIIPFNNQPETTDVLAEFGPYDPTLELSSYKYPTIDLLHDRSNDGGSKVTHDELQANKDKIVETLGNYGIGIASIKATIGPTVTLYEIIPEAGVRISKIKSLEDDIALSLAALGIRIIAPMPGKGTIGIEVPNKNREMVSARSVIGSKKFQESTADLPVVLGKTISNELFVTDLAKMPHLLMAGATGQGKSVGLNILLASLIYKKHPSTLKFVLVDPKKVELTLFNKIERHFLAKLPNATDAIITDTKKVVYTLNSLCIEMDSRYDLLKDAGVRNIKEYNTKFIQRQLNPENGHHYLPYIVLVIDELADLMMTAGKEVEAPIARLAQLARAIGIHLVVATQRPSVNVITGLIKANFPARLSFRVTSKIDSRTILDTGGAEQLVGMGDMLLSMGSDMIRLQCAFIDTDEIDEVCDFIGNQRAYSSAYLLPEFSGDEDSGEQDDVDMKNLDALFDDAARVIVNAQQGSTSLIQRKMKLGYNRAGRIMDQLEAAGIVGAFEGSKAREVLFSDIVSLEDHLKRLRGN